MISYEKYAEIRDAKGLTDGKVAKLAGIGRSTFSDWKSGRSVPKAEKLTKIANALGMNYSKFVGPFGKFSRLNPNRPEPKKPSEEELFDRELVRLYHNATQDAQTTVMTVLKSSQKDASDSSKGA